jgi:thiol-disulfide isomerase/thioredoxin
MHNSTKLVRYLTDIRTVKLTRRTAMKGVGVVGASSVAGCLGGSSGGGETKTINETENSSTDTDSGATQWFDATLEDVRTDEPFTLTDFDQPVLIHMFAIWCSKCDRQEQRVDALRATNDAFRMVSINVDQNEDDAAVQEHANSNGYDWQWVTPPSAVTESLVDEFGSSITVPPSVPMVLLCPDGSYRRLDDGVKSPETLQSALDSC